MIIEDMLSEFFCHYGSFYLIKGGGKHALVKPAKRNELLTGKQLVLIHIKMFSYSAMSAYMKNQ